MFSTISTGRSTRDCSGSVDGLRAALDRADAVLIGAGSGLSTAAGFTYSGACFERFFSDFIDAYGIPDLYTGGFWPFSSLEERWAWWSRHIYYNRYVHAPKPVYDDVLRLVRDKDYFVLTTNVDHQFQSAGFDKKRLFYMQGDYGLWQCSVPCHSETYDNEAAVRRMVSEQEGMRIPSELVPRCPRCGRPMTMNLRVDGSFVQDEGWYRAKDRYDDYLRRHEGMRVLLLELGVGMNTPVWIKYPFWRMAERNENATYACLNLGETYAPPEIAERSICLDDDIESTLKRLIG